MAESALNVVDPQGRALSTRPGDVPDRVRRRYLTDARDGPGVGFYVDARVEVAAFRDHGGRLSTDRNDPHVVRDIVAIAQHRGWTTLSVRGQTEFRREVWMAARRQGLEVQGYQPTERELQQLARHSARSERASQADISPEAAARLRVVEAVVRSRVVEPSEQARILAAARSRLARWLEKGARFTDPQRKARRDRAR